MGTNAGPPKAGGNLTGEQIRVAFKGKDRKALLAVDALDLVSGVQLGGEKDGADVLKACASTGEASRHLHCLLEGAFSPKCVMGDGSSNQETLLQRIKVFGGEVVVGLIGGGVLGLFMGVVQFSLRRMNSHNRGV
ncbi:hypothetical protein CYMTET_10321 [Cymbomonas tetramitiformis]|uniref:Uncharacterized protein n=1 Tax=Cymbomonas tetramitiformis TaxID=36881 RepID=A0AAE0LEK7_9CHLO|nr:hypothetical protein CYMTET_10321 [Cymbomonas tetramitiformis]